MPKSYTVLASASFPGPLSPDASETEELPQEVAFLLPWFRPAASAGGTPPAGSSQLAPDAAGVQLRDQEGRPGNRRGRLRSVRDADSEFQTPLFRPDRRSAVHLYEQRSAATPAFVSAAGAVNNLVNRRKKPLNNLGTSAAAFVPEPQQLIKHSRRKGRRRLPKERLMTDSSRRR